MGLKEIRELKAAAKEPKVKKAYYIPKKSAKKIISEKIAKEARGDNDTELQKWFKNRIKQMKGKCCECGGATNTKQYDLAIRSICHILPKRENQFPSVKFHPLNWIELCWNCHTDFDNKLTWEEKKNMKCFPLIVSRFIMIEPDIAWDEKRKIPNLLLKEIKDPFSETKK